MLQAKESETQLSKSLRLLNQDEKNNLINVIFYLLSPNVFEMPESYREFLEWKNNKKEILSHAT